MQEKFCCCAGSSGGRRNLCSRTLQARDVFPRVFQQTSKTAASAAQSIQTRVLDAGTAMLTSSWMEWFLLQLIPQGFPDQKLSALLTFTRGRYIPAAYRFCKYTHLPSPAQCKSITFFAVKYNVDISESESPQTSNQHGSAQHYMYLSADIQEQFNVRSKLPWLQPYCLCPQPEFQVWLADSQFQGHMCQIYSQLETSSNSVPDTFFYATNIKQQLNWGCLQLKGQGTLPTPVKSSRGRGCQLQLLM